MKARSPLQRATFITQQTDTAVNADWNWFHPIVCGEADRQRCPETIKICIFKQFVFSLFVVAFRNGGSRCQRQRDPLQCHVLSGIQKFIRSQVLNRKYNSNEFRLILNEFEYSTVYLKFGTRKVASMGNREGMPSISVELLMSFL